jgi:hypothetical protein
MHIQTHALFGWVSSEISPLSRWDRFLVVFAAVAPDLDGLGVLYSVEMYQKWHRIVFHNVIAAAIFALMAFILANEKTQVSMLAFINFCFHLICDFFGSAGPDLSKWPVYFLMPFSDEAFVYSKQWGLVSWQNILITFILFLITCYLIHKRKRTPFSLISVKLDNKVMERVHYRFYKKNTQSDMDENKEIDCGTIRQ